MRQTVSFTDEEHEDQMAIRELTGVSRTEMLRRLWVAYRKGAIDVSAVGLPDVSGIPYPTDDASEYTF